MVAQQLQFDWNRPSGPTGEARGEAGPVCQVPAASANAEPIKSVTMEEVVRKENLRRALKRVCANKGSPGIDGMTVSELKDYLREQWPEIRQQLLDGLYKPQPVKQVMIPKPDWGRPNAGHPHGAGSIYPTSASSSINADIRADLLAKQLWVPAGPQRTSGSASGQRTHRPRVRMGRRYRP